MHKTYNGASFFPSFKWDYVQPLEFWRVNQKWIFFMRIALFLTMSFNEQQMQLEPLTFFLALQLVI